MSCQHDEELAAAAAGLPASAAFETHLAQCERCREELSDLRAALALADEALRPLASAEPSPALRARIREAASEAEPTAWLVGWRIAWTAAVAVMVLATALAGWRTASRGRPGDGTATAVATAEAPVPDRVAATPAATAGVPFEAVPTTPSAAPTRSAEVVAPVSVRAAAGRTRPVPAPARSAEPEVLVPPGGEQALLQFVALVHQQKNAPAALLAAGDPSADLSGPAAIEIEPLEIVPLDPAEAQGT